MRSSKLLRVAGSSASPLTRPFHRGQLLLAMVRPQEDLRVTNSRSVDSQWDRQHPRDERLESKLFGDHIERGDHFNDYDNVPVSVNGTDVPPSVTEIAQMNLHPFLMDNLNLYGYQQLTPVQKFGVPIMTAQRDLIASAQTGSGKTAAFLWPIIQRILSEKPSPVRQQQSHMGPVEIPTGLVLAPTRELCRQIYTEALKFSYRTAVKPCLLHGGVGNYRSQLDELRRGCNLMIATPGRLNDILSQRLLQLNECRVLVLDEADRMLDMGFEPQIRQILEQSSLPPTNSRQTAMFTATFAKEIWAMAKRFLRPDHIFLEIGKAGSANANITQQILMVERQDKISQLLNMMKTYDGQSLCLIFANQKSTVDRVTDQLCNAGIPAAKIHGDLSQSQRERNLQAFRSNTRVRVLVATDVAARGLDIPHVSHVVNWDFPLAIDDYVHRIGRTGRMGNTGVATSFVDAELTRQLAGELRKLLELSAQQIPDFLVEEEQQRWAASDPRLTRKKQRGGGQQYGRRQQQQNFYR